MRFYQWCVVYLCAEKRPLDWAARKRIALGSARALVYLHEQCDPKIIHGDVKAANILLEAVVADFGLAKFLDHSVSHVTTAVRGTIGYIAPESLSGQISAKTDVFSYGILLLELILGQTEHGFRRMSGQNLLSWVRPPTSMFVLTYHSYIQGTFIHPCLFMLLVGD